MHVSFITLCHRSLRRLDVPSPLCPSLPYSQVSVSGDSTNSAATSSVVRSRYAFNSDMTKKDAPAVRDVARQAEVQQVPEYSVFLLVAWALAHHVSTGGNKYLGNRGFDLCLLTKSKYIPEINLREIRLVQLYLSDYFSDKSYVCKEVVMETILAGEFEEATDLYEDACQANMERRGACIFNTDEVS